VTPNHALQTDEQLGRSAPSVARRYVDFEGLDDLRVLPLAESYGCNVREGALSLYFRRQRSRELWEAELRAFVDGLET
jgi:hypothetical protein